MKLVAGDKKQLTCIRFYKYFGTRFVLFRVFWSQDHNTGLDSLVALSIWPWPLLFGLV